MKPSKSARSSPQRRMVVSAQPSSQGRMVPIFILVIAFGVRCAGLDTQELRGDEAFGYFFSLHSYGTIVEQTLALNEPHPVASYWLQHLWLTIAGHGEFALRWLGVWWSVLAVALVLPLATKLGLTSLSATVAMALMALSPYGVWHAQDARMYSMSLALTLASTLGAVSWWRAPKGKLRLWLSVVYVAVTWLALQTHYFALYIVAAQHVAFVGWAHVEGTWRKLTLWWATGVGLLLMWLPWLWLARDILVDYRGNGDSPNVWDALVRAHAAFSVGAFSVGESASDDVRVVVALVTLGGIGLGAWAMWRYGRAGARPTLWFLVIYWLTPLVATWLSAQNRPIFNERYLVAAVPPVYLLLAASIGPPQMYRGPMRLRWLGPGLVALLAVTMLYGLGRQADDPRFSKTRGWRELASTLENLAAGVDASSVRFVQNYPDPTLWYYYQGTVPHLVLPPAAHEMGTARAEAAGMADAGVGRALLVEQPSPAWDDDGIARAALQEMFFYGGETIVAKWPVSIWLRPTLPLQAAGVEYVGGLRLASALITPTTVPAGGLVEVYLEWQGAANATFAQAAVSVQLLNSAGRLVAQSDRPLVMASDTTAQTHSYAILLPTELEAGDYALVVVVYDPSQAEAPRRLTVNEEDVVRVGSVTVTTYAD